MEKLKVVVPKEMLNDVLPTGSIVGLKDFHVHAIIQHVIEWIRDNPMVPLFEPESAEAITVTFPKPGVYRVEGDGSFNFIGSRVTR